MNTTMAIRIHALGGPEMLRWEEVADTRPRTWRGAHPA